MSKKAYFYNSVEGDRKYNADSMTDWLKPFFITGVFNGGCQVIANNNMTVTVKNGYANIDGKVVNFDENTNLTIDSAHTLLSRIDNIVIRRNDTERDIYLVVQKGTQSEKPIAPEPVRENGVYDLVIAQVYINASAVSITQANITDTRMNKNLCGWVVSTVEEISFDQIVAQWNKYIAEFKENNEESFKEWFDAMKGQLSTDAAGHLQQEIDAVGARIDTLEDNLMPTITVTLSAKDGSSCVGQRVIIKDVENDVVLHNYIYSGPVPKAIAMGVKYSIEVDKKERYKSPTGISGIIRYATNVSFTMEYAPIRRYGYRRTKGESNPSNRITYLYDAVGKTPAKANLGSEFNYGSWQDFCNEINRPVMLMNNGVVAYELNHNNHAQKIDGSASDYNNVSFNGNAMSEFGVFKWVYRYEDSSYEYVIFADDEYDENYKADAFINDQGVIQDHFYYGMYDGSNISSRLRSIAGQGVMVSQTATTEYNYAHANGSGWDLISKSQWDYILDLLVLIGKSDNLQATYGAGRSNQSAGQTPGVAYNKGQFYGYNDGANPVKVFYIEDMWGNYWQRMNGFINDNGAMKVKMHGPYPTPSDSASAYSDYTNTGLRTPAEGYVKDAQCGPLGFVPKSTGGSETTYFCDYFYKNDSGVKFALVGGRWAYGGSCGRYVRLSDASSNTHASVGSRISHIPS